MIDLFRVWLPQIIGYAELMQDGTLQAAWADGDRSRTSVYYSGELYEQVFGDLHAERILAKERASLGGYPALFNALERFVGSLKLLDEWIEAHVETDIWGKDETIPPSVRNIFLSQQWSEAQSAAAVLLTAAANTGFSSKDFDPTE